MSEERTIVLRIEHPVPDYDAWKREGFDRDPIGRARGGVRRYRVLRAGDRPALVAVELEFDDRAAAESFASALRELWGRVTDRFGWRELPEVRLFELADAGEC
jgi:hypothetical protein